MELWYTEQHTKDVRFSIKVTDVLYTGYSGIQQIDVFQSLEFGKFLTLDGLMMLTEKDEFIYHEMLVHVPMAVKNNVKTVLVIGAGDGGTVREICRYPFLEQIDMVEIDEMVVEVCSKYMPQTASCFSDKRVNIRYEDGLRFIRDKVNEYDVIFVDSTDSFGPGEGLFTREFYGNCYKALKDDGILVNQHETPYYEKYAEQMKKAHNRISEFFPICKVYQAHIPTYPSGHWLFGFASKSYDPVRDIKGREWEKNGIKTKYYNSDIHKGSFALPTYVNDLLFESGK